MVKIKIRENGKFKAGYPYNASIDSYFKPISDNLKTIYNLSDSQLTEINKYKVSVQKFDKELFDFVLKLSKFIKEYEKQGQPQIDQYNNLVSDKKKISKEFNELSEKNNKTVQEYNYIIESIETLKDDRKKINEFIIYYQSQIVDIRYVYNETYINDAQSRLTHIEQILLENENDKEYYKNALNIEINKYVNALKLTQEYSFKDTYLKKLYEAWKTRTEDYYKQLVEYFKNEYEMVWTAGKSVMFDEHKSYIESEKKIVDEIAAKYRSTLFRKYNFELEKMLKLYSLEWLQNQNKFKEIEFTYAIEEKKVDILKNKIIEVENKIKEWEQALGTIILSNDFKSYLKYEELVMKKINYIIKNINNIDNQLLDSYNEEIENLKETYFKVKNKLEQSSYWTYYFEKVNYQELLTELKRQLNVSKLLLSREFKKETGTNEEFYKKIDFFTKEKEKIDKKISEMIVIKDKLEIEKNIFNDKLTLIKTNLIAKEKIIDNIIDEFGIFFENRISFFSKDKDKSITDQVMDLIDNKFYDSYIENYKEIKTYKHEIIWFDLNEQKKLFAIYDKTIEILENTLKKQWNTEFSQEIINKQKVKYYKHYFDKKLTALYGKIHSFIIKKKVDTEIEQDIEEKISHLLKIFEIYLDIAFKTNTNIEIITDIFNYDKKLIFEITKNIETKDNIKKSINDFMKNIFYFVKEKNLHFKALKNKIENQVKIDLVWNELEKKYV